MAKILQENTTVNARLRLFVILPSISVTLNKKPYFLITTLKPRHPRISSISCFSLSLPPNNQCLLVPENPVSL